MKLNRQTIKSLRLKRAWSQSHLAEASGLSLRTIQRIEKQGQASLESVKSLAAVFELAVNDLEKRPQSLRILWPLPVVFALVLGVVLMFPAVAENIMLNVMLSEQDKQLADVQLLNNQKQASEIKLGEDLKLTFLTQRTEDDMVLISVKVYERQGKEMNLVAEPAIMTEHQRPAVIQLDDLSITLEPNL